MSKNLTKNARGFVNTIKNLDVQIDIICKVIHGDPDNLLVPKWKQLVYNMVDRKRQQNQKLLEYREKLKKDLQKEAMSKIELWRIEEAIIQKFLERGDIDE